MTVQEMSARAIKVRKLYDELNFKNHGVTWNEERLMAGLVGDIGDLSKIVMGKAGVRVIEDVDEKLEREIADCFWSLFALADKYNLDVEKTFSESMDVLEERVIKALASKKPTN